MKSIFKFLPALALAATASFAHAQTPVANEEGHMPMKDKKMEPRGMGSGVMIKDGKMMQMKDGQVMDMTSDMTMSNGTKVMTNGQVMMANGKTMMLKDGDMVSMGGQMMHHGGKMKHKMASGKMNGSM